MKINIFFFYFESIYLIGEIQFLISMMGNVKYLYGICFNMYYGVSWDMCKMLYIYFYSKE